MRLKRLRRTNSVLLRSFIGLSILLLAVSQAFSQKSADELSKQIKSLKAEKSIELSFDAGSNTSKVMARSENFDSKEVSKAGLQAMNFGMAFFFAGSTLSQTPDSINLTFWVLTKKPQFAGSNKFIVKIGSEELDLGDARYTARPAEEMEYLNFKIKRDELVRIAAGTNVKFKLGAADLTFTPAQLTLFRNILAVSDVSGK